ncbi:MAG TPA: AAA family ATPase [Bryobacteraceae bacterium]|nr:AAA family ATPase [Bryobacteraceae bacterium]
MLEKTTLDRQQANALISQVEGEINKVIVGQQWLVRRLLVGLLAVVPYSFRRGDEERSGYGHILLEGVPGLAKTLTIMTLASTIDAKFQRIQFTPDMLPADIIGTKIYESSVGSFRTEKGPIFANVILADEINRATQKTQSALLEAMQERQVTIGEETYHLDEPFWVLATQNPVEQEGVYALPEAQIDRFALKINVHYPSHADELEMLRRKLTETRVQRIVTPQNVLSIRELVSNVFVDEKLREYIIRIVRTTRTGDGQEIAMVNAMVLHGASPRAAQHLLALTRSVAFLEGRDFALPEDVKAIAFDALRHRMIRTVRAEAEDITPDEILGEILKKVPIP